MVLPTISSAERGTNRLDAPRQVMSPTPLDGSFVHPLHNFLVPVGILRLLPWAIVVVTWAHPRAHFERGPIDTFRMSFGNHSARSFVKSVLVAICLAHFGSHFALFAMSHCASNRSQSVTCLRSVLVVKPSDIQAIQEPSLMTTAPGHCVCDDFRQFSSTVIQRSHDSEHLTQSDGSSQILLVKVLSQSRSLHICNASHNHQSSPQVGFSTSLSHRTSSSVSIPNSLKLVFIFKSRFVGFLPLVHSCPSHHLHPISAMADATFNLQQRTQEVSGGHSRQTRTALAGEALVKVKDSAVKKILSKGLSSNVQVASFDPKDMHDKDNFFNFVSSWRTSSLLLRQHLQSHCMLNVFVMVGLARRQATDAQGNPQVDQNGNPVMEDCVHVSGENLFDVWHNVEMSQLIESVTLIAEHAKDIDRQNLQWSWEFLLNNVDDDLRHCVMSEVEAHPAHVGQTGPMAFCLVANKIVASTNNLSHNVISGVMVLELRHFKGEDVTECVFVLRNVLKFLNCGHALFNRAPPTIMDALIEVFLHASNSQFRNYIQNLRDFHPADIDAPEALFNKAQAYCNRLLTDPGKVWLPVKKHRASFSAQKESPKDDTVPKAPTAMKTPDEDRVGNIIDRAAPVGDEPRTRVNQSTGKEEHWCGKCTKGGRWGNHLSKDHDEWLEEFRKKQAERKNRSNNNRSSASVASEGSSPSKKSKGEDVPVGTVAASSATSPIRSVLRRTCVAFTDGDDDSI